KPHRTSVRHHGSGFAQRPQRPRPGSVGIRCDDALARAALHHEERDDLDSGLARQSAPALQRISRQQHPRYLRCHERRPSPFCRGPGAHAGIDRAAMMDPAIVLLAKAALTLLFGAAAFHKLRDSREFVGVVAAYRLTSERLSTAIARLLPVLELAVAVGIWITAARVAAALLGAALLVIYAAAIGINLARGRRDIDCGCTV